MSIEVKAEDGKSAVEEFGSSVQLERNSRGYNWVIKLRCKVGEEDAMIERVAALNSTLNKKYNTMQMVAGYATDSSGMGHLWRYVVSYEEMAEVLTYALTFVTSI